jgi:hypothetical protein
MYSDDTAEESACGGSVSVGPTADILSGLAVWQLMKWFAFKLGKSEEPVENEVIYAVRPLAFMSRNFA